MRTVEGDFSLQDRYIAKGVESQERDFRFRRVGVALPFLTADG
jgi:hypothetical protein